MARRLVRGTGQHGSQGGFGLLEMLVAVGILAMVGVAFMAALGTGYQSQDLTRERVTGENLARAALEKIRSLPYEDTAIPSPYEDDLLTVPTPVGYSISVTTEDFCAPEPGCLPVTDFNIQKNTVTVSRGGKMVVSVEDLKARRG